MRIRSKKPTYVQLIVDVISYLPECCDEESLEFGGTSLREMIVREFRDALTARDSRFDREAFVKACQKEDEEYMCPKCGENPAEPEHTCPFKADINDDYETLCTCCDDCRYDCAQEV